MLKLIEGLPDNVLGIEAIGDITTEDYHGVLEPAVDAMVDRYGKVRMLYVLGVEFEKFTMGAMWEDSKVGLGRIRDWERCAVVSDSRLIVDSVKAIGWMFPAELKLFSDAEIDAAKEWIAS